jgi:predicted SAM-dependent methyltransferase
MVSENMNKATVAQLKRSQFIVGLARAYRGLTRDMQVLAWVVTRKRLIADYLRTNRVKKLQLGTSNNILNGWLNTDIFPNNDSVAYMDASTRFPFDDNTFDYIMAEHMIEHIEYVDGQTMLRECFRVLKPGGRVRFATPDLSVLLALHCKDKTDDQKNYIDWSSARFLSGVVECKDVFVINNFFRAWGHSFLYDAETLRHALSSSGFREINFCTPGVSDDPNLENLESHGKEIQAEEINEFETIVVEGCKERQPD